MKYLRQLLMILIFSFIGEVLHAVIPIQMPASGICRQVMREFCPGDFEIVLARSQEDYEVHTLEELLPLSFGPENLKKQGGE